MFYTMQELMAQIKGWEYMIAIVFVILFITMWGMLGRERRVPREQMRAEVVSATKSGQTLRSTQAATESREQCSEYATGSLPCWVTRSWIEGEATGMCDACDVREEGIGRLVAKARAASSVS